MKTSHFKIAIAMALLSTSIAEAQPQLAYNYEVTTDKSHPIEKTFPYTSIPEYPGGNYPLKEYLQSNLEYPKKEKLSGIEGSVEVDYYINTDGSIEDMSIAKSVSPGLDQEALRLVSNMPNWKPAIQDGNVIRVKYRLTITFKLFF